MTDGRYEATISRAKVGYWVEVRDLVLRRPLGGLVQHRGSVATPYRWWTLTYAGAEAEAERAVLRDVRRREREQDLNQLTYDEDGREIDSKSWPV